MVSVGLFNRLRKKYFWTSLKDLNWKKRVISLWNWNASLLPRFGQNIIACSFHSFFINKTFQWQIKLWHWPHKWQKLFDVTVLNISTRKTKHIWYFSSSFWSEHFVILTHMYIFLIWSKSRSVRFCFSICRDNSVRSKLLSLTSSLAEILMSHTIRPQVAVFSWYVIPRPGWLCNHRNNKTKWVNN